MTTYGLLIFDGAEELDFAGPWEVFTVSAMLRDQGDNAVLLAERPGAVRCAKGMQVLPNCILNDHPPLDVLLVPGGMGTRREVSNPALIGWITTVSAEVTSVCTGALLLREAGPARGFRVATHHAFEDTLQARGDITVCGPPASIACRTLASTRAVPEPEPQPRTVTTTIAPKCSTTPPGPTRALLNYPESASSRCSSKSVPYTTCREPI